jgi:hypothetical protein
LQFQAYQVDGRDWESHEVRMGGNGTIGRATAGAEVRSAAWSGKKVNLWLAKRCSAIFLLTNLIPACAGFRPEFALARTRETGSPMCRKIVLRGEVAEKQEWHASIGEGWEFRLVPIGGVPAQTSPAAGHGYSGWDMVVDREHGGGYPDALLLATPPYGSVNEREVGTTYGLRAQDAIAWNPRSFRFFTTVAQWRRARELYAAVMPGPESGAGTKAPAATAAAELLAMTGAPDLGRGEFAVLDARLVAGAGDPPAYARPWTSRLVRVPHTLEQSGDRAGAVATPLGELTWIRFATTLVLPTGWKLPAGMGAEEANCAE